MYVYAGIDEAGYGPLLGPLVVGRSIFAIPNLPGGPDTPPPRLWQRLNKAVCRDLTGRKGRIAVNDSKKLNTSAAGIKHLEVGCLAFAALSGRNPACMSDWLTCLGETCHQRLEDLPWYAPDDAMPWNPLPTVATEGEIAVARSLLRSTAKRIGVEVPDMGAAVVLEDCFNEMLAATRSKAATSFTFVSRHLRHVWDEYGQHQPFVAVDRQGGRTSYRELLALAFPEAAITVEQEAPNLSAYHLNARGRAMTVHFMVEAEQSHMPVALASMISKYTRELFMARFNAWFCARLPHIAPTAGYATDGRRFFNEIQPHLSKLGIAGHALCRQA